MACVVFAALFGPWIAPYDPINGDILDRHQGFSRAHPLGTDFLGRDQLSRLLHGARASFFAALAVTVAVITIATVVGVTAGFCGGGVDAALMRFADMILAFPSLILSLALIGFLGPGLDKALIAMTIASWAGFARIIRGQVLAVRGRSFIEVAECAGGTAPAIIRRHILPNVSSTIVVLATLDIGANILALAGLSFLGLGLRPPAPEWGRMLFDAKPYLSGSRWRCSCRAAPSPSRCSASTCSATACATRSIPAARRSEVAVVRCRSSKSATSSPPSRRPSARCGPATT